MAKLAVISKPEPLRSRVEGTEAELSKIVVEIDEARARIRAGAVEERDTTSDERRLSELEGRRVGLSLRLEGLKPALAEADRKAAEAAAASKRAEDVKKLAAIVEESRLVRLGAVGGGRDLVLGLAKLDALAREHDSIAARQGGPPLLIERSPGLILADAVALALDSLGEHEDPPQLRVAVELAIPILRERPS